MSFGGKLVRGLAAGLGQYYTQKNLLDLEERRANTLMMREQALLKFRQGLDDENNVKQAARIKDLETHKSGLARGEKAQEMKMRADAAAADDARDAAIWTKQEQIKFDNSVRLEEKKHGMRMTEAEYNSRLSIAQDAAKEGLGIDHFETDAKTGTLVGISSKTGRIFHSTIKPVPKAPADPFGFGGSGGGATNWPDRPSGGTPARQAGTDVPILSGDDAQIEAAIAKLPAGSVFIVDGQRYKK